MKVFSMNLGDKIRDLREEKRISIRELGRRTDVTGMHISNLEKGKVNASPELVNKIALALDANPDELLHLADRVDPQVIDVVQKIPQAVPSFLRTAHGKIAMLHSSTTQWQHRFDLDVTLDKGIVNMSGILSRSKSYGAETLVIARAMDDGLGDLEEETRNYDVDPSWAGEINEFADAIINDTPIQDGSSDDALKTMKLVYGIYYADPDWKNQWSLSDQASVDEKPDTP